MSVFDHFNRTAEGYFWVDNTGKKTWADAKAACQGFGSNVHLATLDTEEVGTSMLYHSEKSETNNPVVP